MPLDPTTAESVGSAIAAELSALPKGEDVTEDAWKIVVSKIFEAIVANGQVTIPPGVIVTTGSAATQTGPAAPVPLSIT